MLAERTQFAERFVTLGITPGDGGAWLRQRVVGYSRAAERTFTGDVIDARTARTIGRVARVVLDDRLLGPEHAAAVVAMVDKLDARKA